MTAALLAHARPGAQDRGQPQQPVRPAPDACCACAPEHTAAVLELGMSAAGELRALTAHRAARRGRHHAWWRRSTSSSSTRVDAIAAAKAEILEGLRPGRRRGPERRRPARAADRRGARAGAARVWFGRDRALRRLGRELARAPSHGMRFDLRVGGTQRRRGAAPARSALPHELPGRRRGRAPPRHRRRGDRGGGAALLPARHRGQAAAGSARASRCSTTATTRTRPRWRPR